MKKSLIASLFVVIAVAGSACSGSAPGTSDSSKKNSGTKATMDIESEVTSVIPVCSAEMKNNYEQLLIDLKATVEKYSTHRSDVVVQAFLAAHDVEECVLSDKDVPMREKLFYKKTQIHELETEGLCGYEFEKVANLLIKTVRSHYNKGKKAEDVRGDANDFIEDFGNKCVIIEGNTLSTMNNEQFVNGLLAQFE